MGMADRAPAGGKHGRYGTGERHRAADRNPVRKSEMRPARNPQRVADLDEPSLRIEEQAQKVLATLADANAVTLLAFSEGLRHVDGSSARFALAVHYLAGNRERREPADRLTVLVMRSALRDASRDAAFIDKLAGARSPFWVAVREALVALQAECVTV